MVNILVVDRAQSQKLKRAFPRLLAKAPVTVWIHDKGCLAPEDPTAPGELDGATMFLVGFRKRDWQKLLVALEDKQLNVVGNAKSVNENRREIQDWLEALSIPTEEPFPTTPEGMPDFAAAVRKAVDEAGHVLLAHEALTRANRIASSADHQATGFPRFVALSISALARLAEESLARGTLDLFFKKNAPGCVYAASGAETFVYLSPFTEQPKSTKMHLKPRIEKRGHHRAEHKPRIYFDVQSRDPKTNGGNYVLILHVGPHPETGATIRVSMPALPASI